MKFSIAFFSSIVFLCMVAPARAQSGFPGDDLLAYSKREQANATNAAVAASLQKLFDHLGMDRDKRALFAFVPGARMQKQTGRVETAQVRETILLSRESVKAGHVTNAVIIADGDVEISAAARAIVIASGSIQIAHETRMAGVPSAAGIYIAKGRIEISHAVGPSVYAVRGAKVGYSGRVIAYNTDVNLASGVASTQVTKAPLFRGERARAPAAPGALASARESMPFSGNRCATAFYGTADLLERIVPRARREARCANIASASVTCVQEAARSNSFASEERWTLQLCERTVIAVSKTQGLAGTRDSPGTMMTSLNFERLPVPDAKPAAKRAPPLADNKTLSPEDLQRASRLYSDGLALFVKRDLPAARDKFKEALAIAGPGSQPEDALASVESQMQRADRQAAPLTAAIADGRANARTYLDRGMLFIRTGDFGRGVGDLNTAMSMDNSDVGLALDRAQGYLLMNQFAESDRQASEILVRYPRQARAYEIRAWARFMLNRPKDAALDAFSSLVEVNWTPALFQDHKAGYRVLAGYFALRQTEPRAKAMEWLRQWKPFMSRRLWPDACALYLAGEIEEREMKAVAKALAESDRGSAVAESLVFLSLEEYFSRGEDVRERQMREHFTNSYHAGYTLARMAYYRMIIRDKLAVRPAD
jgi:hypothetical protein